MGKRYIHLGSWNIEHLSKHGGRAENIYALAEHIEMSSLDVLALQEIYVTKQENGIRRNEHIEGVIGLLKEHTDHIWEYEIFENRDASDEEQLCAIMWNSTVMKKHGTLRIPLDNENNSLWDRHPHAVKFQYRDKTDFVVIPLHMKANVGGVAPAKLKRAREAKALVEAMPAVRTHFGAEKDIILIGDTNCLASHEPALRTFAEAGFEDLNEADAQTYVSNSPFDRIFIPQDRKAFAYSRQYIMVSANPGDHDRYLSDHYLIKTVLRVLRDDD